MTAEHDAHDSELIDVSALTLSGLDDIDGTVLAGAVRRLLDDPQEPMAGFSAMIT